MRVDLVRAAFGLAGTCMMLAVVGGGACGGKVVVDATAKVSGGAGGASTSSVVVATNDATATSVVGTGPVTATASSGTGPSCGCTQFCNVALPCGIVPCMQFCSSLPPSAVACVCQVGSPSDICAAVGSCLSNARVDGGDGGDPMLCDSCRTFAEQQGPCTSQFQACQAQTACQAIEGCHAQCGFSAACEQTCDAQNPAGLVAYQTLIACTACGVCSAECAGADVSNRYCLMGG
jgi:hypothetical protein